MTSHGFRVKREGGNILHLCLFKVSDNSTKKTEKTVGLFFIPDEVSIEIFNLCLCVNMFLLLLLLLLLLARHAMISP